jgi:3-hydroxy acid dehydrogenase/malonic semialdehyde reductase
MPDRLDGSTALVTGATSGIGRAAARALHGAGARVVAAGRRADRLRDLAAELGPRCHPLPLDVRDREAVERTLASLPAPFGAVEILVNNAGLALGLDPAPRASLEQWERMIDTNCRALAHVTRILLPGMVERGRGHVVNIGSVAGSYPYPGGNAYGATKAFVRQFSLNLRADLVGSGVRVTCIEPGMTETEFSLVRLGDEERAREVYRGLEPLSAEDVADAILWVTTRPPHVNVNVLELMPEAQGFGPFQVKRTR